MQYFTKINTCFMRDMDKESKTYNCIIPDKLTTPEFELLRKYNVKWEATEKVDGECTSIHLIPRCCGAHSTVDNEQIFDYDYLVEVHGKTENANMRPDEIELLMKIGDVEKLVETFTWTDKDGNDHKPEEECIIFGETYGKGMQKPGGRYCKDHLKFICFDIKIGNIWLKRDAVEDICSKLGIDVVPYLGEMTLDEAIERVKIGFLSQVAEDSTLKAEGIVLRAPLGLLDRMGRRIITKVKTKDFEDLQRKVGYGA